MKNNNIRFTDILDFEDANDAGTVRSSDCTLILTDWHITQRGMTETVTDIVKQGRFVLESLY